LRKNIINKSVKIYTYAKQNTNISMSISVGEITTTFDENMNPNPNPNQNTPLGSPELHKICPWAPKPNKIQGNIRNPDSTAKTRLSRLFDQA